MNRFIKNVIISLIFAAVFFLLCLFKPFISFDYRISDNLYSKLRNTNKDIILITIDEDTLNEYGSFTSWSRDKIADVVNYLYSNESEKPLAVGIDVTFQGESNSEVDTKLANACSGDKNIVVSAPIVFKGIVEKNNNNTINYNQYNISLVEYPYADLKKVVTSSFTNALLSEDSVCRCAGISFDYNNDTINNFSYELASIYASCKGVSIPKINKDKQGKFRFFYAGKEREFSHVSLNKVVDQKIPTSAFKDKIVLIGAYATGMQDAYFTTYDAGSSMNGVEIHANIIQSLLDGYTARNVNNLSYSLIVSVLIFIICFIVLLINNFIVSITISVLSIVCHIFAGIAFSNNGLIIPQAYAIFVLIILILYLIISRLVVEQKRRKEITQIFSRYMDPKIVNRLAKDDQNKLNLMGEKRDVAVLFVDIRGFTTMSENMEPEEVVNILNEYLELVTNCIFKHGGLLDKFIGDAAMAIFNAPVDQNDYVYKAVLTAYDIVNGSKELADKLYLKYGKTIAYGVGVHMGKAVIGNIGSKVRMDYTAIGDTVNTASRIEGKASKNEVLISKEVKDAICDRIIVEDAGLIELKGKAKPINVYRLIDINLGKNDAKQ